MKSIHKFTAIGLLAVFTTVPFAGLAADSKDKAKEKVKPYTLDKCIVSDEKLGDMGDPFVFNHKDREMKLCCKSCKKDFDKDPAKFVKKIEKAEKEKEKAAKKS